MTTPRLPDALGQGGLMETTEPHPAIHVSMTVEGVTALLYRPTEGGWRVVENGPLRRDGEGMIRTYATLDAAAAALDELARMVTP